MPINQKQDGDCGYVAMFNGKKAELYAPSLYTAKRRAVDHFKVSKKQEHLVTVMLAERQDGSAVTHTADF